MTATAKARPTRQERDARIIADIMAQMDDADLAPWQMPWVKNLTKQVNGRSGQPYRGINALVTAARNFADHRWLTFRQAQAAGGNVRKGEKGTRIVFWKFQDDSDEKAGLPTRPGNRTRPNPPSGAGS